MSRGTQTGLPIGAQLPAGDRVRDGINAALWLALGPLAVYGSKGTVVLLALLVLAAPDHRGAARTTMRLLCSPFGAAVGAFFLWAAASLLWTPEPAPASGALVRLALLTVAGLYFLASVLAIPADRARWTRGAVTLAPALTAGFLAIEYASGGALSALLGHPAVSVALPGTSILAVLAFPAAALLVGRSRPWLGGGLIAAAVLVILPFDMAASVLALAAGLSAAGLVRLMRRRAAAAVLATVCVLGLAAPWVAVTLIPQVRDRAAEAVPSTWHRLHIWEFAAQSALERPMLGHGFDSARVIGREAGAIIPPPPGGKRGPGWLPLHPHNVALQIWLELGPIGAVLFAAVLGAAGAALLRSPSWRRSMPAAFGALTAALVIMSLSYGAWQSWWHATLWIAAAACALARRGETEPSG